jgi:hypothetical protein
VRQCERPVGGNHNAQDSEHLKAMLALVVLLATTAVGVASALAGCLPIPRYQRAGYQYSALFGYVPIGGYERGG